MAVAQAASGNFYVVGRYSPPGNVGGQSAWGDGMYAQHLVDETESHLTYWLR